MKNKKTANLLVLFINFHVIVQTLQELANVSAQHYIEPLLRDRINLQLDADNANADLFYSTGTAQNIHYFVDIIRKNLANQN